MPMPYEFRHPAEEFHAFLQSVMDTTGLNTSNQAYTTTEAVLQTFRRRLSVRDGLRFANVLPPVIRALFIKDWNIDEPIQPFATREELTLEVRLLRQDHNFSPETAIRDVAKALRQSVNEMEFDAVLTTLPNGAVEFWAVD
jgi:uncharacterized protein (DUF2267 family)